MQRPEPRTGIRHSYPRRALQDLVDDRAEAHFVEVLRRGQEQGIVARGQADQPLSVWQHVRFPASPGEVQ
jgi:hypothetical protein